jgi:SAM-dependent methyltransferase
MTETQPSMDEDKTGNDSRLADRPDLKQSYDAWERIEDEFNAYLDQSLNPRGPDMLYDLVAELELPAGATALDVGCGKGSQAIELAKRFRFNVLGVDPVPSHIDTAIKGLAEQARVTPGLAEAVRFEIGWTEALPVEDESVDLIWCRDVLELVPVLSAAYQEFHRVLKPGGRALVYQMFYTDQMEAGEFARSLPVGVPPANVRPEAVEATMKGAGLQVETCIVVGSEWGEYAQEQTGIGARMLLHAARLQRDPDRYIQRYGKENYDIALADSFWHVYRLIGKISYRVYLLSRGDPEAPSAAVD